MGYTSLLRRKEHEALAKARVEGRVLDLGGSKKSEYSKIIARTAQEVVVINTDSAAAPDVVGDIEKDLDVPDATFDTVLAMNVLEHVYEYRHVLEESVRVLKSGGQIVVTVPFLFTIHPSPEDYFRYTKSALLRMFTEAGFFEISVKELGAGPMAARYQLLQNFLPGFFLPLFEDMALFGDKIILKTARLLRKKYKPEHFPLGYIVIARKP